MKGFTLIEVLIAMMIIAIAFTAIMKATGDDIEHVEYLDNRITAHWVAVNVMNSVQADLITPSASGQVLMGKTSMLGRTWIWAVHYVKTLNPQILKISVDVSLHHRQFAHLDGVKSLDKSRYDVQT